MSSDSEGTIPLRRHVQNNVARYLSDMGCAKPENLYQLLLAEVEPPLIEEVLRFTGGNQSRAAKALGITRNTLRAKMQRYSIDAHTGKPSRSHR